MPEAVVGAALREVPVDAWDSLLRRLGIADAYLLYGYVAASCLIEPGRPVMLHVSGAGGDVVAVFIERDVPGANGWRDLVTPYGYGGPVAVGGEPPLAAFDGAFRAWCAERRIVSAFIRFHPLLGNRVLAAGDVEVVELAGSIAWQLTAGRDLEAGMHQRHRRSVRRARAAGVEVDIVQGPAALDGFVDMYEMTMRRQQASDFYFFERAYWEAFTGPLRDVTVLVQAQLAGEPIAALLCMATAPYLHYHLGASTDAARDVAANVLCFLEAACWGQAQGFSHLNLGGGVGGSADSLFDFKQRFDPEHGHRPIAVGKWVLDPAGYRTLAGTQDASGFFPAYRRH